MEWRRYVPVAERRAKARREMNKLRKKGRDIQPIEIAGRAIARSFWGKRWCEHLESFSDYANRLPRGRTYVRNGSVCHLAIRTGRIDAIVSGSELYDVTIRVGKLKAAVWKSVRSRCSGQIGSMLELLQGKLSREVMSVVTDRERGLFPKPGEIRFECSCPDWASMCKHVASVLYGVGSRLDDRPESLFSPARRRYRGADCDRDDAARRRGHTMETRARTAHVARRVRAGTGLSQSRFAARFGFSPAAVRDWEQGRRTPEASTLCYLRVIEREPQAVKRALAMT